jgi:hypothetical protein
LTRVVSTIETTDPEKYAQYLAGRHTPLEIVFAGVENGKPKWAITRYFVKKVKGELTIDPEPEEPADGGLVNGVGFWHPADEYLGARPWSFSANPLDAINKSLDTAAIKDHTNGVGGPYAILRLDERGARWLEAGECAVDSTTVPIRVLRGEAR